MCAKCICASVKLSHISLLSVMTCKCVRACDCIWYENHYEIETEIVFLFFLIVVSSTLANGPDRNNVTHTHNFSFGFTKYSVDRLRWICICTHYTLNSVEHIFPLNSICFVVLFFVSLARQTLKQPSFCLFYRFRWFSRIRSPLSARSFVLCLYFNVSFFIIIICWPRTARSPA